MYASNLKMNGETRNYATTVMELANWLGWDQQRIVDMSMEERIPLLKSYLSWRGFDVSEVDFV